MRIRRTTSDPAVALDVLLESRNTLPEGALRVLTGHLPRALANLGLADSARVQVAQADVPDHAIRVSVNDAQLLVGGLNGRNPESMGLVVAWALHADRSAWVTSPAVERLCAGTAPASGPAANGVLRESARELARRGFAVTRLALAAPSPASSERTDAVVMAERAMAQATTSLAVRMASRDAQKLDRDQLGEVSATLWNLQGLVPALRIESGSNGRPGRIEVRINDIWMPRVDIPGIAERGTIARVMLDAALRHAGSLLTAQVTGFLVDKVAAEFPVLASAARARMSDEQITAAMRLLLDDGVSVGDLRAVLEGLLEGLDDLGRARPADTSELVTAARRHLGVTRVQPYVKAGTMTAHEVHDARASSNGSLTESTVAQLHDDLAALGADAGLILLAPAQLAGQLRRAIRPRFETVRVITAEEVPSGITLQRDQSVSLR